MPFQGNGGRGALGPGVLQMLFAQQQARAEARRQAMLDAAEAQRMAIEDARKQELHELDLKTKRLEHMRTEREIGAGLESTLATVNDPNATPDMRHQSARAFDSEVQRLSASGVLPENIGLGIDSIIRQRATEERKAESDAMRAERFDIRSDQRDEEAEKRREGRAEAARIRAESRAAKADELASQAEANAVAAGKWSGPDLDKKRASEEARLSFAPTVSKMWNRLGRLSTSTPNDIYEMTYMAQKAIDDGGVVRAEDVNAWRAQGFSGFDAALAQAQGIYDKTKKYPPGFGENLKRTLTGILASQDEQIGYLADDFDGYASQNGWTPEMRNRAEAYAIEKKKARERIAARNAAQLTPGSGSRPSESEYNAAKAAIRSRGWKGEIPNSMIVDEIRRSRGGAP